jgi:hypothetical protein
MGRSAVFPEEEALPGPEVAPGVLDGDRYGSQRQDGADVGRHVVRPFVGVVEKGIAVGDEPLGEPLQVAPDVGRGVLADDQRGAGVVDKDVAGDRPICPIGGLDKYSSRLSSR